MKKIIATVLIAALTSGCASATASGTRTTPADLPPVDRTLMGEYVQKLPVGSRVAATLVDERRVRGTLLKATANEIVIQPKTRIPEGPVEIPLERLRAVELETNNSSVGRSIAIGTAVGAGAALGVLALLAAIFSD
jgi:hypothetical protein